MPPNAADGVSAFFNVVEKGPVGVVESAADVLTGGLTAAVRAAGITMEDVGQLFKPSDDEACSSDSDED